MVPFSIVGPGSLLRQAAARIVAVVKKHRRPVQYLFSGTILLFLGLYIYRHARELAHYELRVSLPSLALASVLILGVNFLTPLAWGLILKLFLQTRLRWRESLWVWYLSQISKYLPGSVWNYVSRAYLCAQRHISTPRAILSMVLEILLILLAQTTLFLLSFPFWPEGQVKMGWVLLILPIGLILLHPRLLNGLLGFMARKGGLDTPPQVSLLPGNVGGMLTLYTAGAAVVGVAFFFFVNSLYPLPLHLLPALTGIVTLSLIAGFLAPFAPNGLGVREGLLVLLLSRYLPTPVAAVISLASRLWLTVIELIGLLITLLLRPTAVNNPEGL